MSSLVPVHQERIVGALPFARYVIEVWQVERGCGIDLVLTIAIICELVQRVGQGIPSWSSRCELDVVKSHFISESTGSTDTTPRPRIFFIVIFFDFNGLRIAYYLFIGFLRNALFVYFCIICLAPTLKSKRELPE